MILTNATIATMAAKTSDATGYGLIENAAIATEGPLITWIGTSDDLPSELAAQEKTDLQGRLITPAFIDCHTHIVHGGNRAGEFEMRLQGASYEEVARAGGGIVSTVTATRKASLKTLIADALPRVDTLIAEGVSTIEIKSGYGLDQTTELNMLRAARAIAQQRRVRIVTTFLGAHAAPKEFADDPDGYIDTVCIPALKAAHGEGLVDAVDGFCEGIGFSPAQIERVIQAATALGIPIKLHAEQLSNLGGAQLAARYGALSADHLEYATEADAKSMAKANTTAVLLPGAFYTLKETQKPPVAALRDHNVPIALATDNNPGSSPLTSLLLTMNMGCTLFGLTPAEALAGVTANAARALGLRDSGTIAPGQRADLAIWNVAHPSELAYRIGFNPLQQRIFAGEI